MATETLEDLKISFHRWRQEKRYPTQATPESLLGRARAAVFSHGLAKVVKATGLSWNRISKKKQNPSESEFPSYSRIELSAPKNTGPLVEVESVKGHKLRIFSMSPGINDLVSSFCQGGP